MSTFLYSVNLPISKRTVYLTELSFVELKELVKNIANTNNDIILTAFNDILTKHCTEDISNITIIDKLYILLTIRAVCISPTLELLINCPITKQQFNGIMNIDDILTVLKAEHPEDITVSYEKKLNITYGLPTSLYINRDIIDASETVVNCISLNGDPFYGITAEMINKLPAVVLNDIQTHANRIFDYLNKLELINVKSPYSSDEGSDTIITANVFNNSVIEFLKLCFNRDLMYFYKIEYFLMKQFRMTYEHMTKLTPVEIDVYINLFKEEQAEQEKAEKQSNNASNTPNIGNSAQR